MPLRSTAAALFLLAGACALGPQSVAAEFARAVDERDLSDLQLLGKRLFEDTRLSEPAGQSCRSCHEPEHAFQRASGSKTAPVVEGARAGQFGTRKVPTLMYKTYSPAFGVYRDVDDGKETLVAKGGQFWDGRAADLVEQPAGPLLDPHEMNNPSREAVVEKVKTAPYADLARAALGEDAFVESDAAFAKISNAIAAFEQTRRFAPFTSKFDDYLRGTTKFSAIEKRGYDLFVDKTKGNCIACHVGKIESRDPDDWIFTDFTYDALGVPRNPSIPVNSDPTHFDLGLCARPGLAEKLPKEIPLRTLCGKFKVPTLRNVAVSAPYFHNGAIGALRDAVAIYATRDTAPWRWYPLLPTGEADKFDDLPGGYKDNVNVKEVPYDRRLGRAPRLTDQDVDALVAFLKTLTDKGMK